MKVSPYILIILALVIVGLSLSLFVERKRSDNTAILDSIRVQNEVLIESNRIEREAYQDSIRQMVRLNSMLIRNYLTQSDDWRNEYRKTTLLQGPALDSAWSTAIGRIVTKYESGQFDPSTKVRNLSTRTK
jgi:hypothetical protein